MPMRRTHYEHAFQALLNTRGTPYVAVEDLRSHVIGRAGVKTFDYIVYPAGCPAQLVDVKGRKAKRPGRGGDWRQKNWVTQADLDGLTEWQSIFGGAFESVFVFAYWLVGGAVARPGEDDLLDLAGRTYSFWVVGLGDYARHQRQLSPSWKTVSVPRAQFRDIARPLDACWPAAPC